MSRGSMQVARLHGIRDLAGEVALIKRLGPAFRDQFESLGKGSVDQTISRRPWATLRIEEKSAGLGREAFRLLLGQHGGEPGRNRKALACKRDGWLEKIDPRQLAVFLVNQGERGKNTGRAD